MRDWGRFKVGNRDVLNIVRPKEIKIPTILKEIKESKPSTAETTTSERVYNYNKPKPKALKDPRPKAVKEAIDLVKSQYISSQQKLNPVFIRKFLISRLGAVSGLIAFGLLMKDLYDNR